MRSPIFHKLSANAACVFDLTSYDLLALPLKSAPSDLDDAGKAQFGMTMTWMNPLSECRSRSG